jgi:hypothetical protein
VKQKREIVFWEFVVTIVGPRYSTRAKRQQARKLLPRKRLRRIERAALTVPS